MLKYLVILNIFVIVAKLFVDCKAAKFNGKIAGNRTILECVNGYDPTEKIFNPKMSITTSQFARKEGYAAEDHVVGTEDGYVLTLHRIPGRPGAPPVFLQHGIISSSFDWVVIGRHKALAFKLVDAGYDVWLGNFRGNTYSRCHAKYEPSSFEFWDFSWHELGIHDLPATIMYVTNTTGQRIIYIGHSMGTTAFFVMAIERPDIASKVKLMLALAPVAYIDHATSPLRAVAPFTGVIEALIKRERETAEILSQSRACKAVVEFACTLTRLPIITGYASRQFKYTAAPEILSHIPAESSLRIVLHYAQVYNSKRFQYYDHGSEGNRKLYNSIIPAEYNISKIAIPVGVFWSDSDLFSNPIDVMRLYERLPNKILNYRVEYRNFGHIDYLYAHSAPKVYEKLLSVMENFK